jgi:DNA polymerase IV
MKFLCVLLPHFPLRCELLRNPSINGHGAVVTRASGAQKLVFDYSPELDGLQYDMPIQQALSRHGDAELVQADVPGYWRTFNDLLDRLEERSPLVEGEELGQVYLGVDGLQLIYPDDAALARAVREVVPDVFTPLIGIAEGKFPACLAARYSIAGGYRVLGDDTGDFLSAMPCDVLPVPLKTRERLHSFGLHTLGQVSALPAGPLQAQFGPEGKRLAELAAGRDATPLNPRFAKEVIEESTTLLSVTASVEAILVTLENMLNHVFDRLGPRSLGIRGLSLWTRTWSADLWERAVRFKEPSMDTRSTIARLRRTLESYPQPGPVERLGLKITRLGYRRGRQRHLFSEVRAQANLMDDVRQLEMRLGGPQVYKMQEVEPWSRIPERRYALAPIGR